LIENPKEERLMESDPVQTAIERAAARFSAEVWWGSLPGRYRSAAVYAELRKLDAEVALASLQLSGQQPPQIIL
jgi:hypothetical protein